MKIRKNLRIGQITLAGPLLQKLLVSFPTLSILAGDRQSKSVSSFPIQFILSLNHIREFVEILVSDLKGAAPTEPKPSWEQITDKVTLFCWKQTFPHSWLKKTSILPKYGPLPVYIKRISGIITRSSNITMQLL